MRPDFSKYPDTELLGLLADDREPALQELYDRYWERLFNKAYNFLHSEDAAKDCVQEVFIWLWTHRSTVQIENVNNYLHQATRFQALKALREEKAAGNFEDRLSRLTGHILASDAIEFKELKAYLENLIDQLPGDQRMIFRMHREESLTYNQIAEKLGISVKTVEKKMSLALRHLRAHTGDTLIFLAILSAIA
jgi:RNA polymerase sigma-70 factor (ECF subfamily)